MTRIILSRTTFAIIVAGRLPTAVVNQSFTFGRAFTVTDQQTVDSALRQLCRAIMTRFLCPLPTILAIAQQSVRREHRYNCISVGAYANSTYYNSIGPTIDNGRCKPDITALSAVTSFSTPQVAGAAAVLMQAGLRGDGGSDTNSAADIRTVKALLLNGAIKPADWTNNAPSPLDHRYGAGVLNVFNSYEQLAGGKHGYIVATSVSTGGAHPPTGATGTVGVLSGWDFNTNSSSSSSDERKPLLFQRHQRREQRHFHRHRHAGLEPPAESDQHQQPQSVFIQRRQQQSGGGSTSVVDNVEHIFVPNLSQGRYDLQVWKAGGSFVSSSETYALAFEFFSMPLGVAQSGTNVLLNWPIYPTGFILESTTNLISPILWNTNSPAPVVTNDQNYVVLNATNANQFFQLWRP